MPTFLFVRIIVCTQCVLMGEYRALITYIYILCIGSVFLLSMSIVCCPAHYCFTASPDLPSSHEHTQAQSKAVSPPSRIVENAETMSCVYIGSCEVPQSQGECCLPPPPSLSPSLLPLPPSLSPSLPPSLPPSLSLSPYYNNSHIHINFPTSCHVTGIEILNTAVEKLCTTKSHWININISIATSNITITDTKVS